MAGNRLRLIINLIGCQDFALKDYFSCDITSLIDEFGFTQGHDYIKTWCGWHACYQVLWLCFPCTSKACLQRQYQTRWLVGEGE